VSNSASTGRQAVGSYEDPASDFGAVVIRATCAAELSGAASISGLAGIFVSSGSKGIGAGSGAGAGSVGTGTSAFGAAAGTGATSGVVAIPAAFGFEPSRYRDAAIRNSESASPSSSAWCDAS
jgi:hypothetical protein